VRTALIAVYCCCCVLSRLSGQAEAEVRVELSGDEVPVASVSVVGLLADERFLSAMESGFPLHVEYTVELRESRSMWDRTVSKVQWDYVVLFDPVRERYQLEFSEGTEIVRDRVVLRQRLEAVVPVALSPDQDGDFYYKAIVDARTLDDDDVDEVFAWLKGEDIDSLRQDRPGILTRTARRLLVRMAPLPRVSLEGRSTKFSIQ
jgi:hypothetical protein